MSSSVGMIIPNIWKNKNMLQTTDQNSNDNKNSSDDDDDVVDCYYTYSQQLPIL